MSILEYIDKNKEWLFSGIGVVILVFIVSRLWQRIFHRGGRRRNTVLIVQAGNADPSSIDGSHKQYVANITKIAAIKFADIADALDKAPPLQRGDVAQRYIGLVVQWETKLFNADMIDDDEVRLTLDFGAGNSYLVYCNVKLSDYKELGFLPKGSPITVMGKISRVEKSSAELQDVQLFLLATFGSERR